MVGLQLKGFPGNKYLDPFYSGFRFENEMEAVFLRFGGYGISLFLTGSHSSLLLNYVHLGCLQGLGIGDNVLQRFCSLNG